VLHILQHKVSAHFAAQNKKWKVSAMIKLELSGKNAIIEKKIITAKSVERMQKTRNVRKDAVADIADGNVRRTKQCL
jgi:molybdopterin-binding protein